MHMYMKFMMMVSGSTVFLLLIFSQLDWRKDNYANRIKSAQLADDFVAKVTRRPSRRKNRSFKTGNNLTLRAPTTEGNQNLLTKTEENLSAIKAGSRDKRRIIFKKAVNSSEKSGTGAPLSDVKQTWFQQSWVRSPAVQQPKIIVGDQPLFPRCKRTKSNGVKYSFIEPKHYIPESKNPCWFDDSIHKKGFHCIPYFYIAGVAKCGTTDLYRRLRLHPDIMKGTMKEYHFWDRERFGNVEATKTGEILRVRKKPWPFKQYTDLVTGDDDLRRVLDDVQHRGKSDKLFGDGSPSYLWDIINWKLLVGNQGCDEPRVVIGQHIRHIYQAAKIILIFRHPTPRLYSRFLSRIWRTGYLKGANSETFHGYVERGVQLYRDCFKRWSIRQCAYNFTLYDEAVVRLVEGMYPVFMADWLRIWPREQMLLLRNEDYGADLQGTIMQVFHFLGVATLNGSDLAAVVDHQMSNVGSEYDKVGPMKPETVKILDQFYQPFVEQFADLLQDRRFLWRDTYPLKADSTGNKSPSPPLVRRAADSPPDNVVRPAADSTHPDLGSKSRPLWDSLLSGSSDRKGAKGNPDHQKGEAKGFQRPNATIEKPPGAPIKEARFPAWWTKGWVRSAVSGLGDQFFGDYPFFPSCSSRLRSSFSLRERRPYLASCKNPCWFKDEGDATSFRCLPYFYIIGVAKGGTSDLYRRLRHHPDVMKGTMKEYHWWDRGRFGDVYGDDLPIKTEEPKGIKISLKEYTELITGKQGISLVLEDLNKTGKSEKVFGDNSPSYFNDVKFWSLLDGNHGCSEPRVTIGQHIHHVTPNAKLILIVRHPTPRLYLRFLSRVPEKMSLRKGASFAFHRLVKKSVSMYKACFESWSIRHCAYNTTLYQKDKLKLWEGMYSVFFDDWLRVFPRQQIHVIRYQDLVRDTATVMTELFRFLSLPALNETLMRAMLTEKFVERREDHELRKYFGPMVPECVDTLNDFYEPFVDKFAEMVNDERFLWRDTDHL